MTEAPLRRCTKCGEKKILEAFNLESGRGRLRRHCRKCVRAYEKARYQSEKARRPKMPKWEPTRDVVIVGARCLACDSVTFGTPCRHQFADMMSILARAFAEVVP